MESIVFEFDTAPAPIRPFFLWTGLGVVALGSWIAALMPNTDGSITLPFRLAFGCVPIALYFLLRRLNTPPRAGRVVLTATSVEVYDENRLTHTEHYRDLRKVYVREVFGPETSTRSISFGSTASP